jgi:hypothetical protein
MVKLLKKSRKPSQLLEITIFDDIGMEMHDLIPKFANLIQLLAERLPAGNEPELSPVFLSLEDPLILTEGQL